MCSWNRIQGGPDLLKPACDLISFFLGPFFKIPIFPTLLCIKHRQININLYNTLMPLLSLFSATIGISAAILKGKMIPSYIINSSKYLAFINQLCMYVCVFHIHTYIILFR